MLAAVTSDVLTFNDIFKKNVLDRLSGEVTPLSIILALGISFAVGMFILLIYRKTFSGVMYSRPFALSLVMVTMVTAVVLTAIGHNVGVSLGMVGALSIIRFRTAVKDAMDTMYMFWGVATGIAVGAGLWPLAIISALFIGLVMFALHVVRIKPTLPYLLVIHHHEQVSAEVRKMLSSLPQRTLKSKVVRNETVEITVEIRLGADQDMVVDKFLSITGVYDASLLSYQGDMIS